MSKKERKNKETSEEEIDQDNDERVEGEEVTFEDVTDSDEFSSNSPQGTVKKLKKRLKECEKEKAEYLEGWLRAKSDMVNLRKRYEKEAEAVRASSEKRFAERILPVMDSFSMALADQDAWMELPEGWRKGMENIYSQLKRVFSDHDIHSFSPKGEPFDPNLHEAVGVVDIDEKENDNVIIEVIQEGYTYRDELLRTAKVKVGHYPDEEK